MTEEKKAKLTDFDKKAVVFCIYRKLRIKELSSELIDLSKCECNFFGIFGSKLHIFLFD